MRDAGGSSTGGVVASAARHHQHARGEQDLHLDPGAEPVQPAPHPPAVEVVQPAERQRRRATSAVLMMSVRPYSVPTSRSAPVSTQAGTHRSATTRPIDASASAEKRGTAVRIGSGAEP